jgi:hypothetical protein
MEDFGRSKRRKPPTIPITGVSLFIAEKKPEVCQQHPEFTKLQSFTLLNEQWQTLDDATRWKYQKKADYSRRTQLRRQHKSNSEKKQSKISGYSMFVGVRHESLKRTNPELTIGERYIIIAKEWKNMASCDKIEYINAAKRETRRIQKESTDDESENEIDDEGE